MEQQIANGRRIILCISLIFILITLLTIFSDGDWSIGLVRLALTSGLMFCLYKGYRWARMVCMVLLTMAAALSIMLFISNLGKVAPVSLVLLGFYAAICAAGTLLLMRSPQVAAFLDSQRKKKEG